MLVLPGASWKLFYDPHIVEHGVTTSNCQVMAEEHEGVVEE